MSNLKKVLLLFSSITIIFGVLMLPGTSVQAEDLEVSVQTIVLKYSSQWVVVNGESILVKDSNGMPVEAMKGDDANPEILTIHDSILEKLDIGYTPEYSYIRLGKVESVSGLTIHTFGDNYEYVVITTYTDSDIGAYAETAYDSCLEFFDDESYNYIAQLVIEAEIIKNKEVVYSSEDKIHYATLTDDEIEIIYNDDSEIMYMVCSTFIENIFTKVFDKQVRELNGGKLNEVRDAKINILMGVDSILKTEYQMEYAESIINDQNLTDNNIKSIIPFFSKDANCLDEEKSGNRKEEFVNTLAVGDIVVTQDYNGAGHTLLYVGDVIDKNGEKKKSFIHCSSGKGQRSVFSWTVDQTIEFFNSLKDGERENKIAIIRVVPEIMKLLDSYTITYYTNGGDPLLSQTKKDNEDIMLSIPRSKHNFLGWSEDPKASVPTYPADHLLFTENRNIKLYAVWEIKEQSEIIFNANGGNYSPDLQIKNYGEDLKLSTDIPTSINSNYNFAGWSEDKSATEPTYRPGGLFTKEADTTLYAVWKDSPYSPDRISGTNYIIQFDGNGATSGTTPLSVMLSKVNGKIAANGFLRPGYTFGGWYFCRSDGKWWCKSTDLNDSSNYYLTEYELERTDNREKRIFGDKSSLTSGGSYDFTAYAIWNPNTYIIAFNANGGTGAPDEQVKLYDSALTLPNDVSALTNLNYYFAGWSEDPNSEFPTYHVGGLYEKNADKTLYAIWFKEEPIHYYVRFDGNFEDENGSGHKDAFHVDYNQKYTNIPEGTFTRAGYTLTGYAVYSETRKKWCYLKESRVKWCDETEATQAKEAGYQLYIINADCTISSGRIATLNNEQLVYVAQWNKIPRTNSHYYVSFDGNGGAGDRGNAVIQYNVPGQPLPNGTFTRSGYSLDGYAVYSQTTGKWRYTDGSVIKWYSEVDIIEDGYNLYKLIPDANGVQTNGSLATLADEQLVYVAQWKHTVTFDANGGLYEPEPQIKTPDTDLALSSIMPSRANYYFAGWSEDRAAQWPTYRPGGLFTKDDETINTNTTLYAVWKDSPYPPDRITGTNYIVQFDGNGATSGATPPSVMASNVNGKIAANGFLRPGYTFGGWYFYRSDGKWWCKSIDLNDSSNYYLTEYELERTDNHEKRIFRDKSSLTSGGNYDFIAYAIWNPNTYIITFNANGGIGASTNQTKIHGSDMKISSEIPVRDGYEFLGWSEESSAALPSYYANGWYPENKSTEFYAVWKSNDR